MANIDESVVKSYDIRGIYPDQIDEQFAWLLGAALARVLAADSVAIARDARLSSPRLYAALAAGFRHAGSAVQGMGECPTELLYYVLGFRQRFDLGVMITASHNPPAYNGFKVVKQGGEPVTGGSGLGEACALMKRMEPRLPAEPEPPPEMASPGPDYMDFALELVGRPEAGRLNLVVDAGNGVGGYLWEQITGRLGLEPQRLNFEPDGRFPAHHPDPTRAENLQPLVEAVRGGGGRLGFAYDGDADRVVVVLDDGHVVDGSEMSACIARRLRERDPECVFGLGQTISRKVWDHFRARGVAPLMVPVGHAKIKRVLRAEPGMAFAGEHAGHYYYRAFCSCDSALITTLHLLHLAGRGLTDLVGEFRGRWHRSPGGTSVEFDRQDEALRVCRRVARSVLGEHPDALEITCEHEGRVLRDCRGEDIARADGVRVDYPDWWFCVRPSGTEPIARVVVECTDRSAVAGRTDWLLHLFERAKGR